jgi:hypothetical protein
MRQYQIRRMPVIDDQGHPQGPRLATHFTAVHVSGGIMTKLAPEPIDLLRTLGDHYRHSGCRRHRCSRAARMPAR